MTAEPTSTPRPHEGERARSRRLAAWIAGALATLASVVSILGFVADHVLATLAVEAVVLLLPEVIGLATLGATLTRPSLRRHLALLGRPATRADRMLFAAVLGTSCLLVASLAQLELRRLKELRYRLGPGLVVQLERAGELTRAARVADELRGLPWNRRFARQLRAAEQRLDDLSALQAPWRDQVLASQGKVSGLREVDMLLFASTLGLGELQRERALHLRRNLEADLATVAATARDPARTAEPPDLVFFARSRAVPAGWLTEREDSATFAYDRRLALDALRRSSPEELARRVVAADAVETWLDSFTGDPARNRSGRGGSSQ